MRGKWTLILGTVLLALAACSRAFAADAPAARPVLLVIGDSLSAGYGLETGTGWVALLQKRLQERHAPWRVVNASISGETSAGGMSSLPALLQRDQPKLVLIELGGNDALRGLSLAATESNLRSMASACQMFGARVLLIGMRIPPNYGAAYTRGFEAIFPRVAQLQHTALVPFLLAGVVDHPDWFQADNIHPTAAAQPTMLDTVWPVLEPLLQSQARKPGARKP
ncbi:arylesterase [Thiomonas sp. FB-6]|uniref:arylesterase n=1 Tax=Thiomonas sp. FB-6 TaxID=1158291 RepID=UPI0009DBFA03|nr:arylesterase [Thiomonas sp. FB-6]